MGKKVKMPPPPDMSANIEAARIAQETSREQLAWAKEQYARDSASNKEITDFFMDQSRQAQDWAEADRARYETKFQPLEDQMIEKAQRYDTEEYKAAEAARAAAAVDQQYEAARNAAEANLTGYGIDPSQVRAGALDLGARVQEASAKAGAAGQARQMAEAKSDALKGEMINVGKGYPSQVAGAGALATQQGSAALQGNLATTQSGAQTMGTGVQWAGIGAQNLGAIAGAQSSMYNAQLGYRAQMAGNSPLNALGRLAGTALGGWASGGFRARGGAIPDGASPSGGAIPDDVPTMTTPGEYVIPAHIVAKTGGIPMWDEFVRSHGGNPAQVPEGGAAQDGGFLSGMAAGADAGYKQGRTWQKWQSNKGLNTAGQEAGHFAADQVDPTTGQLIQRFTGGAIPFDPEGEGYDMKTAREAGLQPDETGHWPSRDPRTGQQLKGARHPTANLAEQADEEMGYYRYKGQDGRYYSQPIGRAEGGAIPDTTGEYSIPADVLAKKGTDFFDNLVHKSRNPKGPPGTPRQAQAKRAQASAQADPQLMSSLMDAMIPQQGAQMPAG